MDEESGFTLNDIGYPVAPSTPVQPAQPVAAPPVADAPEGDAGFTMGDLGYVPAGREQPKVSLPEDIARTSAAQGAKGVLVDVGGLPGAAEYGINQLVTGAASPETKAKMVEPLLPEQRFDIEEGKAVPFPGSLSAFSGTLDPRISTKSVGTLPTAAGGEEIVSREFPFTQWEAQNKISDIIGSGVRAATSTAASGFPSAAPVAGLAGGAGRFTGQTTEAITGSPGLGAMSEISTNIIADALAHKFGKIASDLAMPNKAAMDRLAQSISLSISKDPERKRILLDAINRGEPINVNDFIDPKTRSWLAANLPKDYAQNVLDFDAGLLQRQNEIDRLTNGNFQIIFGEDLSDSGWQNALAKAQGAETKSLYDAVRANPNADNVWSPALEKLLAPNGAVKKAAREVEIAAQNGDFGDLNVVPPDASKKIVPNFDFWDQVKQNLDAKAKQAYKVGDNFNGKIYSTAAERVRNGVSQIIGEYPEARAAGQAQITTPTALEEGYNFARTLTAKSPNLEKIDDFVNKFERATDEQKFRMQQGIGRSLLQLGQTGDFNQISRLMSSTGSRKALTSIFGPQAFEEVYGEIARNALMKTQSGLGAAAQNAILNGQAQKNPVLRDLLYSVGSAIGSGGFAAYAGSAPMMMKGAMLAGVGSATFLAKAGIDAKEQRVLREAVNLALSTDPEDARRLGRLLSSDVSAVTGLRKYTTAITDAIRTGFLSASREKEQRESRAKDVRWQNESEFLTPDQIPGFNAPESTGGRVQRKSGGRIGTNSISSEVARTRTLLNQNTASMLSMPDDAIVTALTIAKHK